MRGVAPIRPAKFAILSRKGDDTISELIMYPTVRKCNATLLERNRKEGMEPRSRPRPRSSRLARLSPNVVLESSKRSLKRQRQIEYNDNAIVAVLQDHHPIHANVLFVRKDKAAPELLFTPESFLYGASRLYKVQRQPGKAGRSSGHRAE